jgi:hypothetical protein
MMLFEIQNPNVRDRLRYNLLPSGVERTAIVDSISIARLRLAEIQAQGSTASGLGDEELTLRQYIAEYSSLLAPIRLLSVDILQTVFVDPDIHGFTEMGMKPPPSTVYMYRPNVLAAVSHHWRDIVCETTQLWSSFKVPLWQSQYSLERVRLCLERSKDALLSMTFDWKPFSPLDGDVLQEVLDHAERWRHVQMPLHGEFLSVLSPAKGRLHQLETLEFMGSGHRSGGSHKFDTFEVAPKLRFLSLHGLEEDIPRLPWRQLQRIFVLDNIGDPFLCRVLAMTPGLRDITVNNNLDHYIANPTNLELHLPSSPELRKIVILGRNSTMKVLNHMNAPGLKEIILIDCYVWDSPSITSLVHRSGCYPEKLVLQNTRVRSGELLALLRMLPALHTLVLTDATPNAFTNTVVDALTTTSSWDEVALPALTTLVLVGTYLFSTDKLLTMLESRTLANHPPQSLSSFTTIDIRLPARMIAQSDVRRFARAFRGIKTASLIYLNEARELFQITVGDKAPLYCQYTYHMRLFELGAGIIMQHPGLVGARGK